MIDEMSNEEFANLGKNTSKLHFIVDVNRVGGYLFNVKMEYTYFPPRSGRNNLFEMRILKWSNLTWIISSFPIEYRDTAETLANECGLRISNGIPIIIDHTGDLQFPLKGHTVFTLENLPDHKVYGNDPEIIKQLKEEEMKEADAIIEADIVKLRDSLIKEGYGKNQIERIIKEWSDGNDNYDEIPEEIN